MSSQSACCNLPPVEVEYTSKGTYTQFGGLKTYEVGPDDAKAAVFFIYDIFGFAPQTEQGADLIASQGYKVYMPDLLHGSYMNPAWFGSPDGEQKRKDFFTGFPGAAASQSEQISKLIKDMKAKGHSKVGILGLCWGYKAAVLAAGLNEADAFASNHQGFGEATDGDLIGIPLLSQLSKNEDMKTFEAIHATVEKKLPGKTILKQFTDMPHGWTGARADLKDENSRKQYGDAYSNIVDFFNTFLA